MPLYEYICTKDHQFEAQQGIHDKPLKTCREKGCRAKVRRLISKCTFSLKGTGWAADGYGNGKQKK